MNHFLRLFCVVFMLSLPLLSAAQSKKFLKIYAQLKTYFTQADYQATITQYDKLVKKQENAPQMADAQMYKALALLKMDKDFEALQEWNKLLATYPNYKNKDDIYYQIAHYHLQRRQWNEGFEYITKIQDKDLQQQALSMKLHLLSQESLPIIKQLQTKFTQDKEIAQILISKIAVSGTTPEDYFLAQEISQKTGIKLPEKQKIVGVTYTKPHYNIAAFLPFDLKNLKFGQKNTFLTDLSLAIYHGIRIAQKDLEASGKKINIKAYDIKATEKDSLQKILQSPEFKAIDFIIGPLQDDLFATIASVASQEKIYILHPISEDVALLQHDFTYLVQPTPASKGRYTAQFAQKQWQAKKVLIIYDNLNKHKLAAESHKTTAEKMGIQIAAMEQVTANNLKKLDDLLKNNANIDYIIAFTTSQAVANQLVQNMEKTQYKNPLIGLDSWLKFQDEDLLENIAKNNIFFISDDYKEIDKNLEQEFKKKYNQATRSTPQVQEKKLMPFAYLGYELVFFLYDILQKNGIRINYKHPNIAPNMFYKGKLINAIDFRQGNDNQQISILKYDNGQLKLVETP